ncbi:MAG TPA: PEP-CTERM sorting domain-containing protein [Gemmatimonadetes bacterium]|nr:PEP-CTERM sorting domain-containing protein [Gemmatimonadota bacterium]
MGVLPKRQFGVAVPELSGNPPQALPGCQGAGSIGMSRAVEPERSDPFSAVPEPSTAPLLGLVGMAARRRA